MKKTLAVAARAALIAGLGVLASCDGGGYRSSDYVPFGYVYYPNNVRQDPINNGYYYGPRNEYDRPASSSDFDWMTTFRR